MKRKLILIFAILLIVAGVGIFSYPIINQAISAHEQDKIMEDVKAQILKNLNNASATAPEATRTPTKDGKDYDDFESLDLVEMETTEEQSVLDSDRLSGHTAYGIIEIPKIELVYAIVEGVDSWNIGVAIGHFPSSVGFGEEGNCALAGHRGGTSGPYFRDIDELEAGDEVIVTNLNGEEFTYIVTQSMVVEPTDTYVVKDLGVEGKYLTLTTCTNHGTQRLIVRCKME